jgi:hypothetical protein
VFLGLAALIPATVLIFSLKEFAILDIHGDFFNALLSAAWVSFISVWSVYILSIGQLLKNKKIPTSLEGMLTLAFISFGYTIGFIAVQYFLLRINLSFYVIFLTIFGLVASAAVQGFYVGYSKARLGDDEPKGFILRQVGLVESTLILTPYIFISFRTDDDWIVSYSYFFIAVTIVVLTIHYFRAARQSRNYMARRQKNKSEYSLKRKKTELQEATSLI